MEESRTPDGHFPTTRWSRVIRAAEDEGAGKLTALAEVCRAYWFPVYAYVRRKGHDSNAAADLTQDYFVRLLEKGTLAAADPRKGRFRAFLVADIAFFLTDARDRNATLKRGGGQTFVPLDAESRYRAEPVDGLTPERLFDRAWALSVLAEVVDRLQREYVGAGKGTAFEVLKVVLTDGPRAVPCAALADRLGTTEGAVQVAVHRLRRRYRDLVRAEIAATVGDPAEVEDEIRALFAALA